MQPMFEEQQILVTAIPNDPEALGLVEALNALKLDVTIVETAELASHASEAAICIFVLHPETWASSPVIMNALHCKPRYMLPVLVEPMLLPEAPWATGPIHIKGSLAMTAKVLGTLIANNFQILPKLEGVRKKPYLAIDHLQPSTAFVQSPIYKKTRLWESIPYKYLFLALIILLAGKLLSEHSTPSVHTLIIQTTSARVSNGDTFFTHSYTAPIPGPNCDKGPGQWPPISSDNNNVTIRCLPSGLGMTQEGDKPFNGFVSFYGPNGKFPTNYEVKAHMDFNQFIVGCAGFITREDTHAGGYGFFVCANGNWQIVRYDSASGNANTMISGQANLNASYTIEARSDGPVQTLSLDDVPVASVNNSTFMTTDHIDLAMYPDPDMGGGGTVIFSNFVFTPLR